MSDLAVVFTDSYTFLCLSNMYLGRPYICSSGSGYQTMKE